MLAETAYLFRHAVLRDAAYQLQPPAERARLHGLALACLEHEAGGRPLDCAISLEDHAAPHHPGDALALQLADHALQAQAGPHTASDADFPALRRLYLQRAAEYAERQHQYREAARLWRNLGVQAGPEQHHRSLLRAALAAGKAGDNLEAVRALESLLDQPTGPEAVVRCLLHTRLSHFLRELGRYADAESAARKALALAQADDLPLQEAFALGNLANVQRDTGRLAESEQGYRDALAVFQRLGNRRFAAVALANIAAIRQLASDVAVAEQQYRLALATSRDCGDRRFEGITLGNLAIVLHQCGRFAEAEQCYAEALAIHRDVGNRRSEGITLGNLAGMLRLAGQPDRAVQAYESALALHRELNNRSYEGGHLCYYALCFLELRRHAEAVAAWRAGMSILEALGDQLQASKARDAMLNLCASIGVPPLDEDRP